MLKWILLITPFILTVSVFILDVKRDAKKFHITDMEGDLHMLREFKKDFEERGQDTSRFDKEIRILEEKIREASPAKSLWDYIRKSWRSRLGD
jgi:hypothetical protein